MTELERSKEIIQFIANAEKTTPVELYTDEEIKILWQNSDDYTVKLILIYLYTGFRLNELLNIKIENVDLENRLLKGGLKQMLEKTG